MKQTKLFSLFALTLLASSATYAMDEEANKTILASVQDTVKKYGFDASVKTDKITLHEGSIGPVTTKTTIGDSFSFFKGSSVSGTVTSTFFLPKADKPVEIDWKNTLPVLFQQITSLMPKISTGINLPGFLKDLTSNDRYAVSSGGILYLLSRYNTMNTLIDPASSYGSLKQMLAQYGLLNGLAYGMRKSDTRHGKALGLTSAAVVAYSAFKRLSEKAKEESLVEVSEVAAA